MTGFSISFRAQGPAGARWLVPTGMRTPHGTCTGLETEGQVAPVEEAHSGQRAFLVTPPGGTLDLRLCFDAAETAPYPEAMFRPHPSRFTRAAEALLDEVAAIAPDAPLAERARAIACATAERFTYGHPEARFNDGHDAIPALGCGIAEGSCVDINTYFLASLRAAGIDAGYATGFFFPAEKAGTCEDGHCWVVTRIDGVSAEWDIAHHLKQGRRDIAPGLNPKPGVRAAYFHSMGLDFPDLGVTGLKALIEPMRLDGDTLCHAEAPDIALHGLSPTEIQP